MGEYTNLGNNLMNTNRNFKTLNAIITKSQFVDRYNAGEVTVNFYFPNLFKLLFQ